MSKIIMMKLHNTENLIIYINIHPSIEMVGL